jgi:hypothetical protein
LFYLAQASLLFVFLSVLSDLRGEKKRTDLTAEHAKTAEVISAKAGDKDIFSVLVFLAQPADYLFFSARPVKFR